MTRQLPSGPLASQLRTRPPSGSHSEIRLRLDVHTWPRASVAMPMTWPHSKSEGRDGQLGSTRKAGGSPGASRGASLPQPCSRGTVIMAVATTLWNRFIVDRSRIRAPPGGRPADPVDAPWLGPIVAGGAIPGKPPSPTNFIAARSGGARYSNSPPMA